MRLFILVAMSAFGFSASAMADGFQCLTGARDLRIQIYNHTDPTVGTRVPAVVVLSDPSVASGRKTIAVFNQETGLIGSDGARYTINVDSRYAGAKRSRERVLGTWLGNLKTLYMGLNFNFGRPHYDGQRLNGALRTVTENGQRIQDRILHCQYYKKSR